MLFAESGRGSMNTRNTTAGQPRCNNDQPPMARIGQATAGTKVAVSSHWLLRSYANILAARIATSGIQLHQRNRLAYQSIRVSASRCQKIARAIGITRKP